MDTQRPDALAALMRAAASDSLELRVDGVSMGETIVAGSQALVRASARRPRLSEVWAFVGDDGRILVHRFRRRTPDGRFVFRGDAMWRPDDPVTGDRLIGRVTSVRDQSGERRFGRPERSRWIARKVLGRVRRGGRRH
jgi:hypothetical protein